ncbi:MAG TPA: FAD-dependent oxidoreductase, partial [Polyangia bacterium]|nr:FAD-dependent oxidoreductase [Polyangia bacterium]
MEGLAAARGTMIQRQEYPWERDVTDEKPRVGVFICHCGHNIASVVDVKWVAERAAKMPNVVHAEASLYTCSDTNQQHIKDMIREHRLNRLVVASCSPRTHEILFQETLRDSALNPYLFAMTNIRDQCSWVHRDDPVAATDKAIDLMRMAVGRARRLKALETGQQAVTQTALVLGGGLAGMTAALGLADQGFAVHLIEKEAELGGQLRKIRYTLERSDVAGFLTDLLRKVEGHSKITVHRQTKVVQFAGHVGKFHTVIEEAGSQKTLDHGVVVLATGGSERATESYLYGKNPAVLTQRQLEDKLAQGSLTQTAEPQVVMIQCVDSRNEKNPYCSRVCCSEAVKNALELKRQKPGARVVVLYRDIRTYGFREVYYQKAREAGVLFVRFAEGQEPQVSDAGGLQVKVTDAGTGRELNLKPDWLVLSTGIAPGADNPIFSGLLRTTLTADGFFLEAHPKLRPVDLANEGEYLAGLAHSPRFIDETIAHAKAVAGRAATVLSRAKLDIAGQVAKVDPEGCVACATCVKVCPYGAPMINDMKKEPSSASATTSSSRTWRRRLSATRPWCRSAAPPACKPWPSAFPASPCIPRSTRSFSASWKNRRPGPRSASAVASACWPSSAACARSPVVPSTCSTAPAAAPPASVAKSPPTNPAPGSSSSSAYSQSASSIVWRRSTRRKTGAKPGTAARGRSYGRNTGFRDGGRGPVCSSRARRGAAALGLGSLRALSPVEHSTALVEVERAMASLCGALSRCPPLTAHAFRRVLLGHYENTRNIRVPAVRNLRSRDSNESRGTHHHYLRSQWIREDSNSPHARRTPEAPLDGISRNAVRPISGHVRQPCRA